jgi:hypothetical protein
MADNRITDKEKLQAVFDSLVDLALRTADEKNTTGKNLEILPAVVDRIIELRPFVG